MWKLWVVNAVVSLVFAVTAVVATQFILLNLGVPEGITNPVALLAGIGGMFYAERQVRRWWIRRDL
jgi:hypothetical protein